MHDALTLPCLALPCLAFRHGEGDGDGDGGGRYPGCWMYSFFFLLPPFRYYCCCCCCCNEWHRGSVFGMGWGGYGIYVGGLELIEGRNWARSTLVASRRPFATLGISQSICISLALGQHLIELLFVGLRSDPDAPGPGEVAGSSLPMHMWGSGSLPLSTPFGSAGEQLALVAAAAFSSSSHCIRTTSHNGLPQAHHARPRGAAHLERGRADPGGRFGERRAERRAAHMRKLMRCWTGRGCRGAAGRGGFRP